MADKEKPEPFKLPPHIEIISPQPSRLPRGQWAGKRADTPVSVRYAEIELNSLREAAEVLGMTQSDYLRWLALFASQEVMRLYNIHKRFKGKTK